MRDITRRNFLKGTAAAVAVTVIPIPKEEVNAYVTPEEAENYFKARFDDSTPLGIRPQTARVRWTMARMPRTKSYCISGDILVASVDPELMHSMLDSEWDGQLRQAYPGVRIPDANAEVRGPDEDIVFNSHLNATLELTSLDKSQIEWAQNSIRDAFREKAPNGLWMEFALGNPGPGIEQ
jgi:hypothetical protein